MTIFTYGVYVILLDKKVLKSPSFTKRSPDYDPNLDCYYVGMSSKSPEERFQQHLAGRKSCRHVKNHGIRLVPELYEYIPRFTSSKVAKAREKELAVELREGGHAVYWNGDDPSGEDEMPTKDEEIYESMNMASSKAKVDLIELFDNLNDQEAEGVKKFVRWFSDNIKDAGYTRLGKIIKDLPGKIR